MTSRITPMTVEERRRKYNEYMREYQKRNPLSEERREKYRAYQRQYRKENPEKVKQYNHAYIIKKAARLLAERDARREVQQ